MKKHTKRKAFTLTELLVVVVVIGVLAAVVLPKFNKVMETRKTTEAEEIMAAVRTEQEYRCALDKPYLGPGDSAKLSNVLPQTPTKNFNYALQKTGMLASSRGKYAYDLKMPSYADGRICCDGEECNKLNKDYPSCTALTQQPDFLVTTQCTAVIEGDPEPIYMECTPAGPSSEPCGYNNTGLRTRTCNHATGEWGDWSSCIDEEEPPEPTPPGSKKCEDWLSEADLETTCLNLSKYPFNAASYSHTLDEWGNKMASSAEGCCISCQEALGSNKAVWDEDQKDCKFIEGAFEPEKNNSFVQYRVHQDEANPEYEYSFGDYADASGFDLGASLYGVLTQKNPGNEVAALQQSACSFDFLENKYSIEKCSGDMNGWCDGCDPTADTCDRKCYDDSVDWGILMGNPRIVALGQKLPRNANPESSNGGIMYPILFEEDVMLNYTVYNNSGGVRSSVNRSCQYTNCRTEYPDSGINYDIDCSMNSLSRWWKSTGTDLVTTRCAEMTCGSSNVNQGGVYWSSGAVAVSPIIESRSNVYTCVRRQ